MLFLMNGMKVKIKETGIDYSWSDTVQRVFKGREVCVVKNVHKEKLNPHLPKKHKVCDLFTKAGEKLIGFGIKELEFAFDRGI